MAPLTYDEAYQATNPGDSDEKRQQSALALIAGQAANEAYWNSRTELEALKAQADGHGVLVRGADEEGSDPTVVGTGTGTAAPVVEATAVEEPAAIGSGSGDTPPPPPEPDNPTEAVSKLRKQLEDAGITPEA